MEERYAFALCWGVSRQARQPGMDSAWEQKKLEVRKLLVNRAREAPQRPVHIILVLVQDALLGASIYYYLYKFSRKGVRTLINSLNLSNRIRCPTSGIFLI